MLGNSRGDFLRLTGKTWFSPLFRWFSLEKPVFVGFRWFFPVKPESTPSFSLGAALRAAIPPAKKMSGMDFFAGFRWFSLASEKVTQVTQRMILARGPGFCAFLTRVKGESAQFLIASVRSLVFMPVGGSMLISWLWFQPVAWSMHPD